MKTALKKTVNQALLVFCWWYGSHRVQSFFDKKHMIQKIMALVLSFNIRHELFTRCLTASCYTHTHTHTQTAVEVIQETIPEYKSKFAPETRPKLPQKEFSSSIHSDFLGLNSLLVFARVTSSLCTRIDWRIHGAPATRSVNKWS